ncbi:MAG: hypothetical protein A2W90_13275 [Bacteroidetes bacterium GWF2_42_66]|nr:MAG: hypothetical protein A2W92_19215 [Bacteroidetes bacterium GWA2_42_15]OFY00187.1 MAG: hypothetical protein A2W89_18265 [Bacteroidetes bacterium GWE2_42_39]OFY40328.1 MAG: hypothetical protein A2W90_13275 [Bacteroidetes bacterium GWF2_42_66]HBL73685.1 hypothetical protein [Prolixibacteraceae bacterium]HCR90695.1 hypothetical protein [Prolixibacteraceae bacterium]
MKQYTHAWLAMMAMQRLEKATLSKSEQKASKSLIKWFKNNRDFVVQGAWYPDAIIKDMATSHVLKYKPGDKTKAGTFKKLPTNYHLYVIGKSSDLYKKAYTVEKGNLPDRCEALAHSIIDNMKMQESEEKGSPISPTDNHVATLFFMLSHYIADGHMPLHCDVRQFSEGDDIHARIEKEWDDLVRECYSIDFDNERFFYNPEGYPLKIKDMVITEWIEQEIVNRLFNSGYGSGNDNTWDFMSAITQFSYLTAYQMIPETYDNTNLDWDTFKVLNTGISFDDYSKFILIDAIDSIAKVWLRVWMRYMDWMKL